MNKSFTDECSRFCPQKYMFKSPMQRSDLCDYSDAYIVVNETIDLLAATANENKKADQDLLNENNAPFRWSISKINSSLIRNVEDWYSHACV